MLLKPNNKEDSPFCHAREDTIVHALLHCEVFTSLTSIFTNCKNRLQQLRNIYIENKVLNLNNRYYLITRSLHFRKLLLTEYY